MRIPADFLALTPKRPARQGSSRRRNRSLSVRPLLEVLEARQMLSGVTWQVQSAYEGASLTASEARVIRGLALSPDGTDLYAGFIQGVGAGSEQVIELPSTVQGTSLVDTTQTSGSPFIAKSGNLNGQAKGVAVDDRGDVYTTLNTGSNAGNQKFGIFQSNLTNEFTYSIPENLGGQTTGQVSGLEVQHIGNQYYLYVVNGKNGDGLERFNVTNPSAATLDTSFGNASGAINLTNLISNYNTANPGNQLASGNGAFPVNGAAVAADGTIYLPVSIPSAAGTGTNGGNAILKISANGQTLLGYNISQQR
jgi:hypothetical protein